MHPKRATILTVAVLFAAFIWISPIFGAESKGAGMELKSSAFTEGADLPRKHTCDAEDISPLLRWSNVPAGTKAFALIADDPDAPAGTWVHWVIYDLPAETKQLAEGTAKTETLEHGAKQGTK
jgi:phosphatidylethanolamine-binding protein (PEBP) family uncharacterized protein